MKHKKLLYYDAPIFYDLNWKPLYKVVKGKLVKIEHKEVKNEKI